MRRLLLREKPRARLREGDPCKWTVLVADDMGNSAGRHNDPIDLEVHKILRDAESHAAPPLSNSEQITMPSD
eukprot:scaffold87952_cov38-Prasinocladus_malaysianus.AAC.2